MDITLIIVGGLTVISVGGMIFAYLEKRLSSRPVPATAEVSALAAKVAALEAKLAEQETRTFQLEESARFTAKLLEKDRS